MKNKNIFSQVNIDSVLLTNPLSLSRGWSWITGKNICMPSPGLNGSWNPAQPENSMNSCIQFSCLKTHKCLLLSPPKSTPNIWTRAMWSWHFLSLGINSSRSLICSSYSVLQIPSGLWHLALDIYLSTRFWRTGLEQIPLLALTDIKTGAQVASSETSID